MAKTHNAMELLVWHLAVERARVSGDDFIAELKKACDTVEKQMVDRKMKVEILRQLRKELGL
jgi:hypothetical protein